MFQTRTKKSTGTSLKVNASYVGETLEEKIHRIVNNNEPITDGAPLIYTDRSEGVQPDYNPRTDRFEAAVEAMDKVTKTHRAKREERIKGKKVEKDPKSQGSGEATSTQATD